MRGSQAKGGVSLAGNDLPGFCFVALRIEAL